MRLSRAFYLFAALQCADFLTTLTAFHFGGIEKNALVAYAFPLVGPVTGVLICKLLLITIAAVAVFFHRLRPIAVANYAYLCVIAWNVSIICRLLGRTV